MRRIRTALIGLGYWGPQVLRNFWAAPECEMAMACDLDDANLAKTQAHYPALKLSKDVRDIWNDSTIELVLIATPTKTHFVLAKAALEAGKHVFVEKPMTSTSDEARELLATAKAKGKLIFVDHTFVFTEAVRKINDLIGTMALGELLYFDSTRINLGLIQKDTNVLWDLAIHDLSILSTFKNLDDVVAVSAVGDKHFGQQVEVGHLHLKFRDGFHAHIHVSWLSPVKIRQTILAGKNAMLTYDDTEPSEKLRIYDRGVDRDETKADPFFPTYRSGDILIPALPLVEALGTEAAHVLRCVRGEEKPLAGGEEGLKILTILEAADRSLRSGETVLLA